MDGIVVNNKYYGMKRIYLLAFACLLGLSLSGQKGKGELIYEPVLKTDRIIEYAWDTEKSEWALKNSIKYSYTYENGETRTVTTSDYFTGIPVSQIIYSYTVDKVLQETLFQNWVSGEWESTRREFWFTNDEGLTVEMIIQLLENGSWVNRKRYADYQYDNRRLIQYTQQNWSRGEWVNSYYDAYYYDEIGRLVSRQTTGINDIPKTRWLYFTGENNQRQSSTIYGWTNGVWVEVSRRLFEYNQCGKKTADVFQLYKDGNWINSTRQEYIYSLSAENLKPGMKVPVCHNGNTIYISVNALKAHLAHGDCIGECTVEKEPGKHGFEDKGKQEKPPFTIYPNPAREKITIKFDTDESEDLKRVELTDFYGKLLKSFNIKGNSDLTIYREKLLGGKYYVRLIGKEVYSAVVIFE